MGWHTGTPSVQSGDAGGRAVVVPAIAVPSSVACLRSLGRRGIRTIAISEQDRPPAFHSRYCDETYSVPDPAENLIGYRNALLSLAARDDVATILPVREEDVYVLANNRAEFSQHIGTPWPDSETLTAVHDRVSLFDTAERAGVATPETSLLSGDNSWDREWIVKSRYAVLTTDYVDSIPRERSRSPPTTQYLGPGRVPDVDTLVDEMGHVPLLQEFVPTSSEYAFFAIYDHGDALATFQHRQHRGYSFAGGASAFRESVAIPELERAGRAMLDALEWHGVAMVEFLKDPRSDEFRLMEINPRFWSSLPFSVRAGADFPHYAWSLATADDPVIDSGYRTGIAGHLIRGELLYLYSILSEENDLVDPPSLPRAIIDVASSMIRHPRFDYLVRDDPRPFFRDGNIALEEAITGSRRTNDMAESVRSRQEPPDEWHSDPDDIFDEIDGDAVVRLETAGQTDDGQRGNTGRPEK